MFHHAHEATTDDIVSSILFIFHILPTVFLHQLLFSCYKNLSRISNIQRDIHSNLD